MTERPTWKGRLVAVALGLILLTVVSEGILRLLMPHWREFYSGWFMRVVDVPGHAAVTTGRPGFDGHFAQNNGDFRVHIRINAFGLRNPNPPGKADGRLWVIGDSMAFGWGVEEDEMYSSVIGRLADIPVYNVASPGANVCGYQALLARMPKTARPVAVIVGLILENDIHVYECQKAAESAARQASAATNDGLGFREFLIKHTALYNFFSVALKRIDFVREGLARLGIIAKGHAYARQISEASMNEAVERTADELARLRSMLPVGTPMAVLIAPARFEIRDDDAFFRRLRLASVRALEKRQIEVIDPFDGFKKTGFGPTHFAHDGHWSALGHAVAARAAARWLRTRGLGN